MAAKYIPSVMAIGAVLWAYRYVGPELFDSIITREILDEYDYIVVGGGTAGSVLASRLSEENNLTILVLEAGPNPTDDPSVDIPLFADQTHGSEYDWQYKTTPQKHACKGHVDGASLWALGKGLGGTSNINYMQYLRGSRHDYDDWAHQGAAGWAYKDVLPYFIKSEDNRNKGYLKTVFHGFGGRMTVSDVEISPVSKIAAKAFEEWGVKKRDINGRNHFGFSHTQATIRNGVRWSTKKAFLDRCLHKNDINILTEANVDKILFEGRKAVGVTYRHKDQKKIAKARKEILLTAGTIGSAKLLLLSGIGPKAHLAQLKIPIVADVPVGENLQDHVMTNPVEYYTPHSVTITPAKAENFMSSWAYSLFGTGMKMSPRYREGTAFIKIRHQPPHIKYPLLAMHFVANIGVYDAEKINVKESVYDSIYGRSQHKEGFSIFPVLLHPRSRGTVRLASTNPDDPPIINPNYLAEDADAKILAEGLKYARKLFDTQVMKDWEFEANNFLLPECKKHGNFTDAYLECYIRHITLSGYSPLGTCKMGAAGDPTAVVDPNLRVRGVKNLRVVDASVIPHCMSGNTYATQVMIAEKMADALKGKNSVAAIQEYFKFMLQSKHERVKEEEDIPVGPVKK